jgi:hypothetical protein
MILHRGDFIGRALVALMALSWLAGAASAATATGWLDITSPEGQPLVLKMTIDDLKTRFELTGPSYSWFAFGFDATTMQGYAIIVEGINDTRSIVEQNLAGRGDPGSPQAIQNLDFIDVIYNSDTDLSTVIVERENDTGDENDPIFSPSMTSLPIIFAYDSSATVAVPNPLLRNHGRNGRGFGTITFVPEPGSATLLALGASLACALLRRKSRHCRLS